jgi:DNA (cytosine-5)-methyltransferase 1
MQCQFEPEHKRNLTAVDLFSGAGGLTLGLKQAGFDVLAGVEKEKVPAATYRLNHPNVNCFEKDIREMGAAELLKVIGLKRGELDLLGRLMLNRPHLK